VKPIASVCVSGSAKHNGGAVQRTHFHPFLYAAAPVLLLFARDFGWQSPRVMLLPLLGCFALTLLFRAIFILLFRDHDKGAIYASLFMLLFLTAGSLVAFAPMVSLLGLSLILIVGFILLWRTAKPLDGATRIFNLGGASLLLVSLLSVGIQSAKPVLPVTDQPLDPAPTALQAPQRMPEQYPHIFLFHLRQDGHINHSGLAALGFDSGRLSLPDYGNRAQSLAATLNMTHLVRLPDQGEPDNRRLLAALIENNRVTRLLRPLGYRTVAFASGDAITDMDSADFFLAPGVTLDPFHLAAIQMTPLPLLWPRFGDTYHDRLRAKRNRYALDHLRDALDLGIPILTIVCLDEEKDDTGNLGVSNVQSLQNAIDDLLTHSDRPVAIICVCENELTTLEATEATSRYGSLCLLRIPDAAEPIPHAEIHSVNLFPVLLNRCFDAQIPLRPQRHYISEGPGSFEFREMTD
jgi:hypothetical protein